MKATSLLAEIQSMLSLSADDMAAIAKKGGTDIASDHFKSADAGANADWCTDQQAIQFLNGLITEIRGPGGSPPPNETELNNNLIFRKLRIALGLEADDILMMLADLNVTLSKHELSALFRKPGNKHYRACSDELLTAFLQAVRLNNYP
jgi:uncharacterized protein YehS (DUF1456 family)